MLKRIYCRIFQKIAYFFLLFVRFREPLIFIEGGLYKEMAKMIKLRNVNNILIVTDQGVVKANLLDKLTKSLDQDNIKYTIYDQTKPNPTIENVIDAYQMYLDTEASGLIAIGGGSAIDLAKAVGAKVVNPNKPLQKMKGLFKVGRRIPLLVAIPTTVGTGSEVTVASVITDQDTHEKYAINDPRLIPSFAVLDYQLTLSLPKHLVASTAMDALTHAIEAFIGKSNTKKTKRYALNAVSLIDKSLIKAYTTGDHQAMKDLQIAAYQAGYAFTRAYVGNIHALAHQLGGFYNIPHGYANAVILPLVLRYYDKKVYKSLSILADEIELTFKNQSIEEKAVAFINYIENLNQQMDIPKKIGDVIKDEDIKIMAKRAEKEANPLYPVPKILKVSDYIKLYQALK